ncbi:hypothetical protein CASFOL_003148 [Castilleja foliolosa]|uniref:Uncharacterized protein n=1 Tax=Castilleja foliolosa TaxID=1961234 RepID=A0ABD3EI86_9LAMI
MDVQILSAETITPSSPTPHHLRNFKLSFLDQSVAPFYIPLTLFYNTKFDPSNVSEVHMQLKKSLSETLTLFYPLAGRVQDMHHVICNDQGALYTEAQASFTLSEFLQKPDLNVLNKFLTRKTNVFETAPDFQVCIQVSVFSCGGLAIGACLFHRVADIATMAIFLKAWSGLCGLTCAQEIRNKNMALELGSSLFPQLSSIPDNFMANQRDYMFSDDQKYHLTRRFVFTSSAIASLRAKAASAAVPKPSRIESLTGFIIERLLAGLKQKSSSATVMASHAVNIRRRMDPPLPESASGNFVWFTAAFFLPSEEAELPDYVETLRDVFDGVNSEELKMIDAEIIGRKYSDNMGMLNESGGEIKSYKFSSWCNLGFYGLDFGWGLGPVWVAHMGDSGEGRRTKYQFLFMDGKNGGEIELWMLYGDEEIEMLENDQEFLAFATLNPSVLV